MVASQVPVVVEDLGQDGLHLGLAAGHDLAQEVAGVPVHEDPAQVEDDGVHVLMLIGRAPPYPVGHATGLPGGHGHEPRQDHVRARAPGGAPRARPIDRASPSRSASATPWWTTCPPTRTPSSCGPRSASTDPYELMSPVHIPRGFTKAFIRGDIVEDLGARIEAAHARLAEGREALLIEGTGHAGVGAVIGLSNAVVAARLRAPAVIVSEAGVGRPIDEIVLNAALFAQHGVPLAGAVVNKVDLDADPSLAELLRDRAGAPRHRAAGRAALPAHPRPPHPGHAPRADARGAAEPGRRPGPGHRARGHRRHAAWSPARAHRPGHAAHPARRPPGRHHGGRDRPPCAAGLAAASGRGRIRRASPHPGRPARPARPPCPWRAWSSPAASARTATSSSRCASAGLFAYLMDDATYEVATRSTACSSRRTRPTEPRSRRSSDWSPITSTWTGCSIVWQLALTQGARWSTPGPVGRLGAGGSGRRGGG